MRQWQMHGVNEFLHAKPMTGFRRPMSGHFTALAAYATELRQKSVPSFREGSCEGPDSFLMCFSTCGNGIISFKVSMRSLNQDVCESSNERPTVTTLVLGVVWSCDGASR